MRAWIPGNHVTLAPGRFVGARRWQRLRHLRVWLESQGNGSSIGDPTVVPAVIGGRIQLKRIRLRAVNGAGSNINAPLMSAGG